MKGSNSLTHRIVPLFLILILLATALASACAPKAGAPATPPVQQYIPPAPSTQPPVGAPSPAAESAPPSTSAPSGGYPAISPTPPSAPSTTAPSITFPWSKGSDTIGFAVGGSKDINNFRENIKHGYLPLPSDMTPEGLYYGYYFDTGQTKSCNKLYCPSYSYAVTRDPFSNKTEYYLSVGLNSGMKQSDFERKKLNLVIVLDISGSMSSPFNFYYYDQFGNQTELPWEEQHMQKIEVAKDAVRSILDQLNDGDRFGIVLYNSQSYLLQPMTLVSRADMEEVYDRISEVQAESNTNLSAGMLLGTDLLEKYSDDDPYDYENRIIFLTDAMPNTGETGEYSLLNMLKNNAANHMYTTFIGIGVDFNTELIEYITKTRGANYYSVHSPHEFMGRVDDEFDYMVTPLVFNLRLTLDSDDWQIEQVYGSPEADKATGELMKVNTLFPSKKVEGETKGGLILLKLRNIGDEGGSLRLKTSYEDRAGRVDGSETKINLTDERPEYFENSGIRKGVLLARYADLVQNWLIDEREHASWSRPWEPRVTTEDGICVPPSQLGQWERTSLPLTVSSPYRSLFRDFSVYFSNEINEIGDNTMLQELQILRQLGGVISYGGYED
ncbi:MAG: VWA domain-containing protein [Dehalococcoidia bacterium]|jgi:Ca-activated chloride channel family protein